MPDFSLTEARPQLDFRHILAAIAAFFAPAILEELVFRVLPIPHRDEHAGRLQVWVWATVAVTVYVAWHPLNAWLFHVAARPVFYAPGFLATTTVLGACCAIAYRRSGSLWPPVAIHWAVVAAWLLFYDGAKVFWAA